MKYFRIENFINQDLNQLLIDWSANNHQAFAPSTVTTSEKDYRKSLVAYSCPFADLVTRKIETLIPVISSALDVAVTQVFSLESQITVHGNRDFFKIHTDKNDLHCLHRAISYAYYFHSLPKMFQGGELALYSDQKKLERTLIAPDNNTLVCFPSMTWHEVLPVVGSLAFDHGRFTVNGWINCL